MVAFAVGAIVFGIGTSLLRGRRSDGQSTLPWMAALGDERAYEPAERIELIERLAMVGQPWCVELLTRAADEEGNARVRRAAREALLRCDRR
ncbi:MAG TPA: hypothetical protein VMS32_02670 [Verrucomicrobiae bacterium]|nr:hypothetical protein [Verrucomicrobiae bacterium]